MLTQKIRLAAVGFLAVATFGTLALGSTSADAAKPTGTLGALTAVPATGTATTAIKVDTSAGCPDSANGYVLTISGPGGFASPPEHVVASGDANFSSTSAFEVSVSNTMADIAKDLGTSITAGQYNLVLRCVDSFAPDVSKGTFATAIFFTSPTAYQSNDPNAPSPSPSASHSPSPSATRSPSPSPSPIAGSPSPVVTESPSATPSPTPVASESAVPSPSISSVPEITASPVADVSPVADPSGAGRLPTTGSTTGPIALGGLLFVGVGAGALVLTRRRRKNEQADASA